MARKLKTKSTFRAEIEDTRFIMKPAEMLASLSARNGNPEALGVFIRLLPYMRGCMKKDFAVLARMAAVHVLTMRRLWPDLAEFFVEQDGKISLAELPWLKVQQVPVERQRLRHLFERLVSYWGNCCAYCGTEEGVLEIEHVVPVVRGGTDDLTNLTLACRRCNSDKRTKTAAEFGHPHIHELAAKIQ
jgi:HNH endonuclease